LSIFFTNGTRVSIDENLIVGYNINIITDKNDNIYVSYTTSDRNISIANSSTGGHTWTTNLVNGSSDYNLLDLVVTENDQLYIIAPDILSTGTAANMYIFNSTTNNLGSWTRTSTDEIDDGNQPSIQGTRFPESNRITNKLHWVFINNPNIKYENMTIKVPAPAADTSFSVSLPQGYTKCIFNATLSTSKGVNCSGQNASYPFLNISNDGNVALDFIIKGNETEPASIITIMANNSDFTGFSHFGTDTITIYNSLSAGSDFGVWFQTNFSRPSPGIKERNLSVNSSET